MSSSHTLGDGFVPPDATGSLSIEASPAHPILVPSISDLFADVIELSSLTEAQQPS